MIEVNEKAKIWVYGYSNVGRNAYRLLKEIYGARVQGIIETKQIHKGTKMISEISLNDDDIVFICTNPKFHNKLRCNVENSIIYTEEIDQYLQSISPKVPLLETKFMVISVGQACSLKCRDCANFSPYAQKENRRYELESIKRDIEKTFLNFSKIDVVHIQGGEPFLYSQLVEVLEFLEQYNDIYNKIQIGTNGTIIPNEDVLAYLKLHNEKIEVRISKYTNINIEKLILSLEKENIKYRMYDFVSRDGKWKSVGSIEYYDDNDNEEYQKEKIYNCPWSACFTIENGMIGRCARSIPAYKLQEIKYREDDYIKIEKSKQEDFRNYFMFMRPMECCRFCAGGYGKEIAPAIQLQ